MNTLNQFVVDIDARATRARDALISLGAIKIKFKNGVMSLEIENYIRDLNRDLVVQIERELHHFIGTAVTSPNLQKIMEKIHPYAVQLKVI